MPSDKTVDLSCWFFTVSAFNWVKKIQAWAFKEVGGGGGGGGGGLWLTYIGLKTECVNSFTCMLCLVVLSIFVQITKEVLFFSLSLFEFVLLCVLHMLVHSLSVRSKSWLVMYVILLPSMSALFTTSLTQTAGRRTAALTVMFSSNIDSERTGQKTEYFLFIF